MTREKSLVFRLFFVTKVCEKIYSTTSCIYVFEKTVLNSPLVMLTVE